MIRISKRVAALTVLIFATPTATAESLVVDYGDCAYVLAGPRCVLNDARTLRLWVRATPGATVDVDNGRRALNVLRQSNVEGGTHFEVEVPRRSRRIRVVARDAGNTSEWSIALATDTEAPRIGEFRRLYKAGEREKATALILRLAADDTFAQRGIAHRFAGAVYHNSGAPEKARAFYQRAIELSLQEGRWMEAVRAASALSYLLQHTFRDFGAARAAYAPFADIRDLPAEARYFRSYDMGLLGFNTGDRRVALTQLERAASQAIRMGSTGRWQQRQLDAEEVLASQLQRLGRRTDAQAYFNAWQSRDLGGLAPCERAYFYSNAAWSALIILEAGDTAPDPTAQLESALTIMRASCKPWDIANGEINLALAHFHAGRYPAADAALDRARAATQSPDLRLRFWELDIGARLAAARGDTDMALAMLEGMSVLASATLSPDAAWRAAARRGVILEQLGQAQDALLAYAEADARLQMDLQTVPFHAGRGQFSANREWVLRRRLSLLYASGANADMAQLIRTANRRAFSALATQDNSPQRDHALAQYETLRAELAQDISAGWRVPADELALLQSRRAKRERTLREWLDRSTRGAAIESTLPRPAAGEALLVFHPLVEGWVVIAITADTVTSAAPDCAAHAGEAATLAQCLIHAVAQPLHQAKQLSILANGALAGVDFHALTFAKGTVIDALPVRYTLDLKDGLPATLGRARALVVGDATRQLPASRREAQAVAATLSDSTRMAAQTLFGGEATFAAVRSGLDAADIFHFAGHATYESQRAWTSALALANDDALSVTDILSLSHAPGFVMLSACDTARGEIRTAYDAPGHTQGDFVGLAQAFILRGAHTVIATARPVNDKQAQAFSRAFYQHWHEGVPAAVALQRAQQSQRQNDPTQDWAAYRLISN